MRNSEYAWLQISDLHIFDNTEINTIKAAYQRLPYKEQIKFIVVTGDLHQYQSDYKMTITFLENLLDIFNLRKTDIFIVPGNHDSGPCNLKDEITESIENKVDKDQDCYRKHFVKGRLVDCFDEYNEFIQDFYGKYASVMYPNPEQVSVLTWNDTINIIHLNTAINCNGDNSLKQIVDIYQLSNFYEKLNKNYPSIIIAHHPFDNIHKLHRDTLRRNITDWKVSAYLCGDLHQKNYIPIHTYTSSGSNIPCIVCGKGAPENLDEYSDLGCVIYYKRRDSEKVTVYPFTWDSERKTFEPYSKFNNDRGTLEFELLKFHATSKKRKKVTSKNEKDSLVDGESIWLPDAEHATGIQARFETFARNNIINEFIQPNSKIWGLSAVKGIGKTYLLQIKSRQILKENKLLLPLGIERAAKNNWGTDTIHLETNVNLSGLLEYENVVVLWQYCIVVYVVNQLSNISNNTRDKKKWPINNPEVHLNNRLKEIVDSNKISKDTYSLCTCDVYENLDLVMKGVLACKDWINIVHDDYPQLVLLRRRIKEMLEILGKESVAIMVDKVDQSVRQANAQEPDKCEVCEKRETIELCSNPNKSEEYCKDENTACRSICCYGCETFESAFPNTRLRIYGKKVKSKEHINVWQYLQIGLLEAVSIIKTEFEELIEVYFTIRQEAFACDNGLLGDRTKKITNLSKELSYSKEQQRTIFNQCISHQRDEYLYDPDLKKKEGKYEIAFVGVDKLCHPYAKHLTESVFDSIYRHSFDRARDIQEYGQMLTEHIDEIRKCDTFLERGEKVKELIEKKAAEMAFVDVGEDASKNECYYVEKIKLLPNFWTKSDNFKKFILMFDKNLLMGSEAKLICQNFNNLTRCEKNCADCKAKYHPFSMLYKLGLLGQIVVHNWKNNLEQEFLDSQEVSYITGDKLIYLNTNTVYLLHPALTKSIEKLNKKVKHFSGFIIGKGLVVPRKQILELQRDFNALKRKTYDKKYFYTKD